MKWPVPRFDFGAHVRIRPLEDMAARVVDVHIWAQTASVEYDVRYFIDGKEQKIRVFEDELDGQAI
jgi:hypothetical protein